ncbi:Hypothetical protein NTJ_14684 [Nesidiocoris tenuis]|uniref:Uncharacterized protein n=1 Tax=Nesidiocoris tenuis TaxID=355587 RepID=A0ABN7BFB8_9HEMI|nr:Hypothetical protein NTJ_14684 [Nesidiocoris tenuis]
MLKSYLHEVKKLRSLGKDWNLSDEEIDRIIDDSFRFLETEFAFVDDNLTTDSGVKLNTRKLWSVSLAVCAVAILCCALVTYRRPATNYLEKNLHQLVYPGMKLLRKIMLPVVKTFPSLTEWYDEACLISNRYFQVPDLDCWPCENVKSVLNLTTSDVTNEKYHSGIPFITKDPGLKKVGAAELRRLYRDNKEMFDKESPRAESQLHGMLTAEQLFSQISTTVQKDMHITWRLNRLEPTRAVRTAFGMPRKLPSYTTGVTPEKFLLIDDSSAATHQIPVTEGSTVYVIQGSGSRLYILDPSPECRTACQRISVVLEPHHILWYNWWYWRCSSAPIDQTSELSVSFVGSYF